jgi:hypothetical protein
MDSSILARAIADVDASPTISLLRAPPTRLYKISQMLYQN